MAYQMATTAVTLNDLKGNSPVTGLFKCTSLHIPGMAEARVVKFCAVVGYIKLSALGQLTVPEIGGQGDGIKFRILHPMKYLRNG